MAKIPYSHPRFVFSVCALGGAERVWLVAEDGNTYRMLQLKGGKWIQKSVPWQAVTICGTLTPAVEIYMVGTEGEVLRGVTTGFGNEDIDPVEHRPQKLGEMREVRCIGGKAFVAGMARQVYRRDPDGWHLISAEILPKKKAIVGFHSIDGTTDELVAVGLNGEIWRAVNGAWHQVDSPTNVSLNRVRLGTPGVAYACGQGGMLLEIAGDTVRVAAEPLRGQNFYGLAWFKNNLYVSTPKQIFVLRDGALVKVDVGIGTDVTSGYLETNGESLWSVGAHHLLRTDDGAAWVQVTCDL